MLGAPDDLRWFRDGGLLENDRVGDSEGDVALVFEVYVYDGQRSCSCCRSSSCWVYKSRYF